MRVYRINDENETFSLWLTERGVATLCHGDVLAQVCRASAKETWGCVLSSTDPGWTRANFPLVLKSWNCNGRDFVEAATVEYGAYDCLVACPSWAKDDPFVRTLVRKLSGTKPPPSSVDWEKCEGLVPVIAQDAVTKDVLMQAYMDEVAWEETLRTGRAVYFSRSRRKLWRKGEESGHIQMVRKIWVDCDCDSVILEVEQVGGAACHTGHRSCFFQKVEADERLTIVGEPVFDPKVIYKK
jgi:phosphoribosyl-AMP cyclohydrolase